MGEFLDKFYKDYQVSGIDCTPYISELGFVGMLRVLEFLHRHHFSIVPIPSSSYIYRLNHLCLTTDSLRVI